MSEQPTTPFEWRAALRDPALWAIVALGLVLRLIPLIAWPQLECLRDECIYRSMADDIYLGRGLTESNKGWLPSPAYPYVLAWTRIVFGGSQAVKGFQVAASVVTNLLAFGITRQFASRQVAIVAAALFAFNPTIAWFTNTMWIETFYMFFLLAAAFFTIASREARWTLAAAAGALLGVAMLFKGIATYLPPAFLLAVAWPGATTLADGRVGSPWRLRDWVVEFGHKRNHVAALLLSATLVVAPWSLYASRTYGGFMIVDATVGHVLYLGNNDFDPITFDYGNGMLTEPLFKRYLRSGRNPCPREGVPAVLSSKCEVNATVAWAKENPGEFVGRIPMRVAQLLNPNSFLTRHVRWGYFPGLPYAFKEGIAVWVQVISLLSIFVGTVGVFARARGPYAYIAIYTVVYTVFTTMVSYGMTRFRMPLELLWAPYVAIALVEPRATLAALRASPPRLAGLLVTLPPLLYLTWWYLLTGFPSFW